MPKGRIGLSLSEDVLAILNRRGRSEKDEQDKRLTRTQLIEEAVRYYDTVCWSTGEGCAPKMSAEAYAEELERHRLICPLVAHPSARQHNGTPARSTDGTLAQQQEPAWGDQAEPGPNSLSGEAAQARKEKRAGQAGRKAELGDMVSRAFEGMGHEVIDVTPPESKAGQVARRLGETIGPAARSLERGKVAPIPKPGKR